MIYVLEQNDRDNHFGDEGNARGPTMIMYMDKIRPLSKNPSTMTVKIVVTYINDRQSSSSNNP